MTRLFATKYTCAEIKATECEERNHDAHRYPRTLVRNHGPQLLGHHQQWGC